MSATIYTVDYCPFCVKAKNILIHHNIAYTEINISSAPEKLEGMLARSNGRKTFPQIFIKEHHVGGCDDLMALSADDLSKLLS